MKNKKTAACTQFVVVCFSNMLCLVIVFVNGQLQEAFFFKSCLGWLESLKVKTFVHVCFPGVFLF